MQNPDYIIILIRSDIFSVLDRFNGLLFKTLYDRRLSPKCLPKHNRRY